MSDMTEQRGRILVGTASDLHDGKRLICRAEGREIVVLKHDGAYHAFDNHCRHMGGPVGEGVILGKVEAVLDDAKRCVGERFSDAEIHLVCPWHGWEYDLATGEFAGDRSIALTSYQVIEQDGDLYVEL